MKCKNLTYRVSGAVYNDKDRTITKQKLNVICTNDELGKSISIDNGEIQFTIPFDYLLEIFEGDYRKK